MTRAETMKRMILRVVLSLLVCILTSVTVWAESGNFGTNLKWEYNKGTLTITSRISSSEDMPNYSAENHAPWYAALRTSITTIVLDTYVKSIGSYAFDGCTALKRVDVKRTSNYVGLANNAFNNCAALDTIVFPTCSLTVLYNDRTNWSSYKAKFRTELGGYAFPVTGTTADNAVYAISNEDDLRKLAEVVNNTSTNTTGKTFRQTANIVMSNNILATIGSNTKAFRGTYDGNKFFIENPHIQFNNGNYIGLFGNINQATIKDVRIISPVIFSKTDPSTEVSYGVIVGNCVNSTVSNCFFYNENDGVNSADNPITYNPIQTKDVSSTVTNSLRVHKLTIGNNVSTNTEFATNPINGFAYKDIKYFVYGTSINLVPSGNTYTAVYLLNDVDNESNVFTMPNKDVRASVAWKTTVNYIDQNGASQSVQAIIPNGDERALYSDWYVVGENLNYTKGITLHTNTNLILADGKTMNVTISEASYGINGNGKTFSIYGQTQGTGTLNVTSSGNGSAIGANVDGTINIRGGVVNATYNGTGNYYAIGGSGNFHLNITGGQVTATSNDDAIFCDGTVTITGGQVTIRGNTNHNDSGDGILIKENSNVILGCTHPSDFIFISTFYLWDNNTSVVSVTASQTLSDGTNIYNSGNIDRDAVWGMENVTFHGVMPSYSLHANAVELNSEITYWTTFYSNDADYQIPDAEDAYAYTAVVNGSVANLHLLGKVIPKGTAVILVGADNSISLEKMNTSTSLTIGNHLRGVDVATTKSTLGSGTFYVLGNQNAHFGFHQYTGTTMPGHKAYLLIDGSAARELTISFGESVTGISENEEMRNGENENSWYTLEGRKLHAKPTKPGLYIFGNKKLYVK